MSYVHTANLQIRDYVAQNLRFGSLINVLSGDRLKESLEHLESGLHRRERSTLCQQKARDGVAQDLNGSKRVSYVCVVFLWKSRREKHMMDHVIERLRVEQQASAVRKSGSNHSRWRPADRQSNKRMPSRRAGVGVEMRVQVEGEFRLKNSSG